MEQAISGSYFYEGKCRFEN